MQVLTRVLGPLSVAQTGSMKQGRKLTFPPLREVFHEPVLRAWHRSTGTLFCRVMALLWSALNPELGRWSSAGVKKGLADDRGRQGFLPERCREGLRHCHRNSTQPKVGGGRSTARGHSVEIPSARRYGLEAGKWPDVTPVRTRGPVYAALSLMSQLLTRRPAGMREFSVSFCSASIRTCWQVLTNTKHAWDS